MPELIFISTKEELVKLLTDIKSLTSHWRTDSKPEYSLCFNRIAKMPSRYYVSIYSNNVLHLDPEIRCTDNIVELVEPITDLSDNGMAPFSLLIPYLTRSDKIDKLLNI